jgi:hypothetical protein
MYIDSGKRQAVVIAVVTALSFIRQVYEFDLKYNKLFFLDL